MANELSPEKNNCFDCRYFYITHEPRMPYGCRAAGFKSLQLPSVVVLRNSGSPCLSFCPKKEK